MPRSLPGTVLLGLLLMPGTAVLRAQAVLTLKDAIHEAQTGPAAQITAAEVDEFRGGVRQAGLGINPRLYLQSEDLRPWADNFAFQTQAEDYAYVGQTFEADGKRRKRVNLAKARLQQAEANREVRLRLVAGRVAAAYGSAVGLERIAGLLQQDIQAVDEMVDYQRKRVDAGASRGVDLLRMKIERDRLKIALEAAQREASLARLELFRQIGTPARGVTLTDRIEDVSAIPPSELPAVLAQRADVQVARDAVKAAEADVTLQRANGVPDPDFLGGYKRNLAANTLYASLQIPLPLRNRNQGEVERAQASVAAAQASLKLLETQIGVEVKQAQQAYEAQQKIVTDTLPEMRANAKKNLDIISEAYRIGGIDLLRFLDAERTEFDVEVTAVRTLVQLQQSALQLQLVYGVQP